MRGKTVVRKSVEIKKKSENLGLVCRFRQTRRAGLLEQVRRIEPIDRGAANVCSTRRDLWQSKTTRGKKNPPNFWRNSASVSSLLEAKNGVDRLFFFFRIPYGCLLQMQATFKCLTRNPITVVFAPDGEFKKKKKRAESRKKKEKWVHLVCGTQRVVFPRKKERQGRKRGNDSCCCCVGDGKYKKKRYHNDEDDDDGDG